MLRKNQKALQVRIGEVWAYVFCNNPLKSRPITTKDRGKALGSRDLEFFKNRFGSLEFRVIGGNEDA